MSIYGVSGRLEEPPERTGSNRVKEIDPLSSGGFAVAGVAMDRRHGREQKRDREEFPHRCSFVLLDSSSDGMSLQASAERANSSAWSESWYVGKPVQGAVQRAQSAR